MASLSPPGCCQPDLVMTVFSRDTTAGALSRALSRGRELALVSAFYLLLTAILTYPTVLRLNTHIPGSGDAPTVVWDLWALSRALIDPQVPLRTTDLIFYPLPDVVNIWQSPGNVLVSLPLAITIGPVPTYNLIFLSSFVLGGLFFYLLARHLSGDKLASFAAGAIFSFSAYHYAHGLGHLGLYSVQWLPLCALCLLRLRARPDSSRAVQFAVSTCLVVVTFPYFGAYFLLPLLACFFLYYLWRDASTVRSPRFLAAVALALAVAAAGTLLFYGDVLFPQEDMAAALRQSAKDTERYSADLLAFVLPSASHPVFGDVVAPIYENFSARGNPAEMTIYIGIVALLLAVWGLWRGRGDDAPLWAILALVALVMSLGPTLRVNGKALFPLPYALLMRLPLFAALRAPGRISITVLMSVSVLAGYGLRDLLDRVRYRPIVRTVTVSAVVLVVCFETLLSYPYQSSSTAVPPLYYERLPTGSQRGGLFQLPSGPGHSESTGWYMFYQIRHHRALAIGYQSREPLPVVLFPHWVLRGRFLSPPVALSETDNWPAYEACYGDLLAYNDIRCVVVQRQAGPFVSPYSDEEYREVRASLSRSLGDPLYEEEGLVAYEISPVAPQARASFSGKLELVDHKLVETSACPDGTDSCTFLVTFWRASVPMTEQYGLWVQLIRHNRSRVLAATSHNLGYQFRQGDERAYYNTSWWAPGVVVTDYALLPSTDSEGLPLFGPIDIKIRVTDPKTGLTLDAQSDQYAIDERGRLLIESYRE